MMINSELYPNLENFFSLAVSKTRIFNYRVYLAITFHFCTITTSTMLFLSIALVLACYGRPVHPQSTTTFGWIVKAHPTSAGSCPPGLNGHWSPDKENYACCWTSTSGGSTAPQILTKVDNKDACCLSGYACTGSESVTMFDWVVDVGSECFTIAVF
jgi:hypothetical protein